MLHTPGQSIAAVNAAAQQSFGWLGRHRVGHTRWPIVRTGELPAESKLFRLGRPDRCKASHSGQPRSPGPAVLTRRSAGHRA
jgi:hypothetical protein